MIIEEVQEDFQYALELTLTHVSSDSTVLLFADTELIQEFIKGALEEKSFTLLVVLKEGQSVKEFQRSDLIKNVVFIDSSSVFSILPRVQRVFMDCHSVMSDGTVIASAGGFNIALVAKEFNVPVFVISPQYKFSP